MGTFVHTRKGQGLPAQRIFPSLRDRHVLAAASMDGVTAFRKMRCAGRPYPPRAETLGAPRSALQSIASVENPHDHRQAQRQERPGGSKAHEHGDIG